VEKRTGMTMNRFALAFPSALLALALACDPGSKSVSGTAEDGGGDDAADDGASTGGDDDGAGDGLSATSGPPGGDDDGTNDPVGEPACLESITPLAGPDEVSPLGFPASDLVALSNGWSTTFGWFPPDGPVDIVPAGTETTLDIGLSYLGGPIAYVDSEPNPDYPNEIVVDCEDRLEIEVEIVFRTADGRFDEQFLTTATATTPDVLTFRQPFDPDAFQGTFSSAEVSFGDDDGVVEGFDLGGQFTADADPSGTLAIEIVVNIGDGPDGGFAGYGIIASWPAGLPE
jgi:hypothetical protein